jgi:DNA polymerase I-like protein with 3'-5' exonuclease and polymerase domains
MPFEVVANAPTEVPEVAEKKPRKPRATKPVITIAREGFGPFGLAKGAPVDTILTEWDATAAAALDSGWIGLDLETSGLDPYHDWIAVVGLHSPATRTAVVLHVAGVLPPALVAWIGRANRQFVTHNGLNFDILFLASAGVAVAAPQWYDTLVGEQVVTGTDRRGISKKLQDVVKRRIGTDIYKDVDHRDWLRPSLTEQQVRYVAEDISFLTMIREAQLAKAIEVDEKWGLNRFYNTGVQSALDFEHELLPTVVSMQLRGLPVDEEALLKYSLEQSELAEQAKVIVDKTFGEINWNSPPQIKRAFKSVYDIELPSTKEEVLIDLADLALGSPVAEGCRTILQYRAASKRSNMYNAEFYDRYTKDGWLRSNFRPTGTDTGRFASANPNLQQIPKDKGKGGGLRHVFGNLDGWSIVSADYSQIEVRIAANEAEEWEMIKLFKDGGTDIHTLIASQVFGKPTNEVSKDERQLSKAMSFTLLFGGGALKLSKYAKTLGADLPLSQARPLVVAFFDQFEQLARFRARAYRIADSGRPYTLNLPTGIRRVLTPGVDLTATRILNNIVQGTAAAGLKYALKEAANAGIIQYLGAVVHDEIVMTVPTELAEEVGGILRECMIRGMVKVCELAPVDAEVSIGRTWG